MKLLLFVLFQVAFLTSQAQFFSGKYHSDPPKNEFDLLKIQHHRTPKSKFKGDLTVIGVVESSELWELKAKMIFGERANSLIDKFAGDQEIQTVYEFKLELDGIEEDYLLLGFENEDGQGEFIGIEKVFEDASEEEMLLMNTFRLYKKH